MNETAPVEDQAPGSRPRQRGNRAFVGVVVIVLGVLFLLESLIPGFSFGDFWPLLLIAAGIGLLWGARKNQ